MGCLESNAIKEIYATKTLVIPSSKISKKRKTGEEQTWVTPSVKEKIGN